MAVLVVTMAVIKAVVLDLVEPFEFLLPKTTLIPFCSEEGVQQGHQGSEASPFRVILPPLSEINSSIRHWRKGWERRLVTHV